MKNLFPDIASIILSKSYVLVTSKLVSPNKQNSVIFRIEIGLYVIFVQNAIEKLIPTYYSGCDDRR